MADTTTIEGVGTTSPPTGFIKLSALPKATPFGVNDLLHVSQVDPLTGLYASRRASFDQVCRGARPPADHLTGSASATVGASGFTADASLGDIILELLPLEQAGFRELPIINAGPSGLLTLIPHPGESVVTPFGLVESVSLRPGETVRVRAVSVPAPARSGWYLVCV